MKRNAAAAFAAACDDIHDNAHFCSRAIVLSSGGLFATAHLAADAIADVAD